MVTVRIMPLQQEPESGCQDIKGFKETVSFSSPQEQCLRIFCCVLSGILKYSHQRLDRTIGGGDGNKCGDRNRKFSSFIRPPCSFVYAVGVRSH